MYRIPEPTEEPEKALVMNYKISKGVNYDDRVWDKRHFRRCMVSAKELLEICGIYERARRCLEDLSKQFEDSSLSWTFETITKHAHDYILKQGKRNDQQTRQRFLDALIEQRAKGKSPPKGEGVTGGEILAPLRNLSVFQPDDRDKNGTTDSADGKPRERMG